VRLPGFRKTEPASAANAMRPVAAINVEIKLLRVALILIVAACLQPIDLARPDQVDSIWIETKWPFLMDQWGEGRSFQCKAEDCGAELKLFIRAKVGFCSSTTGVSDDNELERLSDFDFMDGRATALGGGREIDIAGMKGRLRTYATAGSILSQSYAFSVAFNNNSDALVATVTVKGGSPAAAEPAIIQFLNGQTIQRWVSRTLGL
jgi:hypothetical protein